MSERGRASRGEKEVGGGGKWPLKKVCQQFFHKIQVTTPPRSSRKLTVMSFIKFFVAETKRFISSNVNVILTRQTCGQRSSSVLDLSWCGLISYQTARRLPVKKITQTSDIIIKSGILLRFTFGLGCIVYPLHTIKFIAKTDMLFLR